VRNCNECDLVKSNKDWDQRTVILFGAYPGVEIDPSGAGDHLDKIDIRIRRLKELMRCMIADLPYTLSKKKN